MMQGQQRPQKHEHEVESIKIIGPLAYEIGALLDVLADGTQRYYKVVNFYAKDETGWRLIFSAPADNVGKALSSSPVDISRTQNLSSSERKRRI